MTTLTSPRIDELILTFIKWSTDVFYFLASIHQGELSKVAPIESDNETLCLNRLFSHCQIKKSSKHITCTSDID